MIEEVRVLAERANSIREAVAAMISIESFLTEKNLVDKETLARLEEVIFKILINHARIALEIIEKAIKSNDRDSLKIGLFCCEVCLGILQTSGKEVLDEINLDKEGLDKFRSAITQKIEFIESTSLLL